MHKMIQIIKKNNLIKVQDAEMALDMEGHLFSFVCIYGLYQ